MLIKNKTRIISIILVILSISSLYYYSEISSEGVYNETVSAIQPLALPDDSNDVSFGPAAIIENDVETPGNYKTLGFFTQDKYVDLDENGNVFEWELFADVKDSAADFDYARFRQYNRSSDASTFWHPLDTWGQLRSNNLINGENINSTIFTPTYTVDTYLQGKVFFKVHCDVYPSAENWWELRITMDRFNPNTGQTVFLGSTEGYIDDGQRLFNFELANTTLLPAGYRLRITYESSLWGPSYVSGSDNNIELRSGNYKYDFDWTIDDSNNTYDNSYHIDDYTESFGMQLYGYQEKYPTIDITGFTNNTIYYEATNATISVIGSVSDQYQWNTEPIETFGTSTIVSLPETIGWHTLVIESEDLFENTAQVTFVVGYDPTGDDVILESPSNNSLISDGQMLNFTISEGVDFAFFKWQTDSVYSLLEAPFDFVVNEGYDGIYNLTIRTDSFFGTKYTIYYFNFDNSAPIIGLDNVVNNTQQPLGKNIDVEISDESDIDVLYKWDSDSFVDWTTKVSGNVWRTTLPTSEGWHNLTVYANDTFGHDNSQIYSFYTNTTYLLVELTNMVNGSYYMGGDNVEITIINDNGTVKYFWGNNAPKDGFPDGNYILTLSGIDALSSNAGTYSLTVWVFDAVDILNEFVFVFTVDKKAPTIIQADAGPSYNQSRFLDNTVLSFIIADNWTSTEDMEIYISLNNENNQTFSQPLDYYLSLLSEGQHNLTIVAFDIAGNYFRYYIEFTIDISAPVITISSISGLATLPDSTNYVPANSDVTCIITDTDPTFNNYYSWNDSSYTLFVSSFTLPSIEGTAILIIYSNDTLGNDALETLTITIDNTHPTVSLNFIQNNSKINEYTPLNFKIEDLSEETIDTITSQWNLEGSSSPENAEFTATLSFLYQDELEATITIFTEDIVGNSHTIVYKFFLDFDAPNYALVGVDNDTYIRGNTLLDFNVLSADLQEFSFRWDADNDSQTLTAPYDIIVPSLDGVHVLYIELEDDTGGGLYTNTIVAKYVFTVDDIEINYLTPGDFSDDYYYVMKYGESFTFSVDVRDTVNNTVINGLTLAYIEEDTSLNLGVTQTQLNSTSYEFRIDATNVTDNTYKYIEFQFWQFGDHKQSVTINLLIQRGEGNLLILDSTTNVVYGEDISISLKLFDNTNSSAQAFTFVSVNNNYQDISYVLTDAVNFIYEITFNSADFISAKGNHLFEIYIESNFYFGIMNDTSSLSATILPVPIILSVNVSSSEIVYGNDLVIYAELFRADGTPVAFQDITFSIYIVYKDVATATEIPTAYNDLINKTTTTDANGLAQTSFEMTEEMDYVVIFVSYSGSDIYDPLGTEYTENVFIIDPAGLPIHILIMIIAGSLLFTIVMSFVIYRLVRARPFEELMEKVSEQEIDDYFEKVSPGVILSLFDQAKGPVPLIMDHSLEQPEYSRRMRIGVDNFLLKISDQAYSSLGFEEHDEKRRIGSINLPNEDMIAFIHGIQLENKNARGGFENLSLIILADTTVGGLMLSNQEFMFVEIDELILALKEKKTLTEIKVLLEKIRRRSVIIMIAAKNNLKKSKEENKQYQ